MRTMLLAALAVAAISSAAEARTSMSQPAPMRQAGTLTCAVDPTLGLVVGSTRGASCSFVSNYGSFSQGYVGRIDRVGFDVGIVSGQTMTWRVYTPGGRSRSGMLSGLYAGSSAEATFVVGAGTQMLVNGNGERIALEPTMGSGQAGFNFAVGAAGFELRPASLALLR